MVSLILVSILVCFISHLYSVACNLVEYDILLEMFPVLANVLSFSILSSFFILHLFSMLFRMWTLLLVSYICLIEFSYGCALVNYGLMFVVFALKIMAFFRMFYFLVYSSGFSDFLSITFVLSAQYCLFCICAAKMVQSSAIQHKIEVYMIFLFKYHNDLNALHDLHHFIMFIFDC